MVMQPDFDRIVKTVRHEEPDRVPLCEVLIEYPIQSHFLGRKVSADDFSAQVEFWSRAGYDYIPVTVGMMSPGRVTEESAISRVIRDVMLADTQDKGEKQGWNLETHSFIKNREDFQKFPWEIAGKLDLTRFYTIGELLPEKMKTIAVSGKIFTLTWMLMGFNDFGLALVTNESLVGDVFRKVAEIQLNGLEQILELPHIGAVWVVDDLAFGTGPIISPQAFRDHVFPWYRKMADECHRKNRLFFFHSDGNVEPLLEDLIQIGVDLIQPIDPTCMDIFEVKKVYGEQLCIAGNVPNEMLRSAEGSEIDEYVKALIQELAPGGGYCLGAGNSVPEWAQFKNYMAMRNAGLKYGQYPIKL